MFNTQCTMYICISCSNWGCQLHNGEHCTNSFSQPPVARTLIEQSGSAEIGLSQRFLWWFPHSRFHTLESVDTDFTECLGEKWLPMLTAAKSELLHVHGYFYVVNHQAKHRTPHLKCFLLSETRGHSPTILTQYKNN